MIVDQVTAAKLVSVHDDIPSPPSRRNRSMVENPVPRHKKAPARRPGHQSGEAQIRSVAAVHQPPARTPGGGNQAPRVAAAISAAVIGRAADEDAGATPAVSEMMPAAMVKAAAPGRGRCRRQRGPPSEAAATATSESLRNMIVSSKFRRQLAPSVRSGPVTPGAGGCACPAFDRRQSTAAKLNTGGTAASDRVHLREIAVIFATAARRAARKHAKKGWQARHTVACRREVAPI